MAQQFIDAVRNHDLKLTEKLLGLFPDVSDLDFLIEEDHLDPDDFSWLLEFCPSLIPRLFLRSCDIGNTWTVKRILDKENLDQNTIDIGFLKACSLWLPATVKILLPVTNFSLYGEEGFSRAMRERKFETAEAIFDHLPDVINFFVYITDMFTIVPRSLLEKAINHLEWEYDHLPTLKLIGQFARYNGWSSLVWKTDISRKLKTGDLNLWKKNLDTISIMQDSKADTNSPCVVCLENEPIIVFNCGHKKTCAGCTKIILTSNRKCPICREDICTATKVYD
jgi:hypothetical protein